ncbi:Protein of unknown function DUF1699 [Methanosalsum zhilinae DSM 4017]|uniref:Ribosomal protein S6 n=1 Tax=Methanosalsum zhilinae (strain DSM 4017 / NBRC 107636 / OCM 62 / WeN5) TaxID=679901 RepID=F7XNF3_METZD|nr:DUF1699 family protein [Methanosalsum zhilinae]AEH61203.1 Protein of unknown function DUF1699 [Methanosalsum zhilinae DSM 4017]
MKIRVVSSRNEIQELNPGEKVIHLAFRPSNKDIFTLVQRCPDVEVIQLPGSYRRTVSKSIEMFLEMQGIRLIEGDVWGHRKDINEYYTVSPTIKEKINALRDEGKSDSQIIEKLSRETKINEDMLIYILENE